MYIAYFARVVFTIVPSCLAVSHVHELADLCSLSLEEVHEWVSGLKSLNVLPSGSPEIVFEEPVASLMRPPVKALSENGYHHLAKKQKNPDLLRKPNVETGVTRKVLIKIENGIMLPWGLVVNMTHRFELGYFNELQCLEYGPRLGIDRGTCRSRPPDMLSYLKPAKPGMQFRCNHAGSIVSVAESMYHDFHHFVVYTLPRLLWPAVQEIQYPAEVLWRFRREPYLKHWLDALGLSWRSFITFYGNAGLLFNTLYMPLWLGFDHELTDDCPAFVPEQDLRTLQRSVPDRVFQVATDSSPYFLLLDRHETSRRKLKQWVQVLNIAMDAVNAHPASDMQVANLRSAPQDDKQAYELTIAKRAPQKGESINPGKQLSLIQVLTTFARAHVVLGAHGGLWVHTIFCPSGINVVELNTVDTIEMYNYHIASVFGFQYWSLLAEGNHNSEWLVVDMEALKDVVSHIVSHNGEAPEIEAAADTSEPKPQLQNANQQEQSDPMEREKMKGSRSEREREAGSNTATSVFYISPGVVVDLYLKGRACLRGLVQSKVSKDGRYILDIDSARIGAVAAALLGVNGVRELATSDVEPATEWRRNYDFAPSLDNNAIVSIHCAMGENQRPVYIQDSHRQFFDIRHVAGSSGVPQPVCGGVRFLPGDCVAYLPSTIHADVRILRGEGGGQMSDDYTERVWTFADASANVVDVQDTEECEDESCPDTYAIRTPSGSVYRARQEKRKLWDILSAYHVEKIYIISLQSNAGSREKAATVVSQLIEFGMDPEFIDIFDGVDGQKMGYGGLDKCCRVLPGYQDRILKRNITLGEAGATLSHVSIWKQMAEKERYHRAIILEDDPKFADDFMLQVERGLAELFVVDANFDFVYLSRQKRPEVGPEEYLSPNIARAKYSYWANAYLLSSNAAKRMVAADLPHNLVPTDEFIPMMYGSHVMLEEWAPYFPNRQFQAYAIDPLPIAQDFEYDAFGKVISSSTA
mmetsp:Transcript_108069/g.306428  ORF Transcript_108069/g.306428 Transcript_108069/m.306428 type:complete len:979 (+) Transcript_108069:61-2997(+)